MQDLQNDRDLLDFQITLERNSFIAKVYGLLALSLVAGAAATVYGIKAGIGKDLFWPLVGLEFFLLFFTMAVQRVRGVNLLALFSFVASTGLVTAIPLGVLLKVGLGAIILPAFCLAVGLFLILSLYVLISGRDFSFMGGFLFAGLTVLIAGWIFHWFFPGVMPGKAVAFAGMGVILFSGYVLYDTSMLVDRLDTEDYVYATVCLYLDILNLFMDFLRLLLEYGVEFCKGAGDWFDVSDFGDLF